MSGSGFHGLERPLTPDGAVRVFRITHPANQPIEVHAHDWACLTLFVCGSYVEHLEPGTRSIGGPAAVFYPPGCGHANQIGQFGLETVSVQIDAAFLRRHGLFADCPRIWIGGSVGRAVRHLIHDLTGPAVDHLQDKVRRFLEGTLRQHEEAARPPWLDRATALAQAGAATGEIARRLDLHPAWLARRFLQLTGESVQGAVRRRRAEHALHLIRSTELNFAAVAATAAFCDQSHMNRSLRELLGRTPKQLRAEARPQP